MRRRGFTLVELIVVLALIGIIFGIAVPRVENLTPKYAMRSAARSIASTLEYIRSQAVYQGKTFAILYDLKRNMYIPVFAPPEYEPDLPFELWPRGEPQSLPTLVRFHSIIRADNSIFQVADTDQVPIRIDPMGASGSHVVVLTDADGHVLSVKFNALTGTVDFYGEIVAFARL